jgi:hypothetical protein
MNGAAGKDLAVGPWVSILTTRLAAAIAENGRAASLDHYHCS